MKRTTWIALVAISPALLLAGEKQTCPMGPFDLRGAEQVQRATYHTFSVVAETVAPTRRRPSDPPSLLTPYPSAVNLIDTEIFGKMAKDGVPAAALSSDTEFLRRVTLDLTGAIPDPATVQSFLADTSADKRTRMIDQLLASDAFADRWTMWFGDLVQNVQSSSSSREFPQGRNTYYTFIRDSIRGGKAYDQLVRELLAGKGDAFVNGGADYWVRQIQPNGPIQDTYDNLAAHSGEKFLGMPMQCLSCHNGLGHLELVNTYLKSKTRADFWGNAAFFARTRTQKGTTDPTNPNIVSLDVEDFTTGNYTLNTTSGNKTPRTPLNGSNVINPAFLLTGEGPRPGENWRDAYARILTAHPQFARASVNYIWKEMFGLGIVEPANNFDLTRLDASSLAAGATLQPTHPGLLRDLASEFAASRYNLRWLLRTITTSNAYQLSSSFSAASWNESWTPYFARHLPQRLPAEQLLDAITRATNVPVSFTVAGLGTVNQALKLPDPLESRNTTYGRFLDDFGRGNRDDDPRSNDASISQALSLMNNATVVVNRIHRATANSTVAKALAASTDPAVISDTLYLATLSRYPTASEKAKAVAFLKGGTLAQRTEDLQWVLLNSVEFLLNDERDLRAKATANLRAGNRDAAAQYALRLQTVQRELLENRTQLGQAETTYKELLKARDVSVKAAQAKMEALKNSLNDLKIQRATAELSEMASGMISTIGGSGDTLDRLHGMVEEEREKAAGRARVARDSIDTSGIHLKEAEQTALAEQALADFAAKEGLSIEPAAGQAAQEQPDVVKSLGPSTK